MDFKTVGIYVAMSALQGGFGLPLLLPHLYDYLTMGKYTNLNVQNEDVPEPHVRILLQRVILVMHYSVLPFLLNRSMMQQQKMS